MFVHYNILQYYHSPLFALFQTIRIHCIYKYVRSLRNPSILSHTLVYSLPDYQTSLYIQMCSFITKSFNIILYICLFFPYQTSLYIQICSSITKFFNIILFICLLSSSLSNFTVHTNMFVHYKILQYYPLHFTLFQTIRLHCTYKYVRSLQNPSILSS